MASDVIPALSRDPSYAVRYLRTAALIAVVVGAVGSVGLTLHAGRHNNSRLLLILFALWVLSPFAALVVANVISKRRAVQSVTLLITLGTLAIYGYVALGPPRAKTAPVFVVVPPVSWLLTAVVVLAKPKHILRA